MSPELDDYRQALSPPQFGMRSLLALVALFAVLCAIAKWVGAYAFIGVLFIVMSIVAHVVGAALGKQLRDHGSRRLADGSPGAAPPERFAREALEFAPATKLRDRIALGKPLYVATSIGAVGGALGGGIWIAAYVENGTRWDTLAVGILAFAILGAFWTFLCFAFIQVTTSALYHASREPQRRE